jgi:hypothetical protein
MNNIKGYGDEMSRQEQLAASHWEYIENTLDYHYAREVIITITREDLIDLIGHHYRTSMVHGYGHGYEDAKKENS